jgi:hypothetical protein
MTRSVGAEACGISCSAIRAMRIAPGRFYDELYERSEVCCVQANVNSEGTSLSGILWYANVAHYVLLTRELICHCMRPPFFGSTSKTKSITTWFFCQVRELYLLAYAFVSP